MSDFGALTDHFGYASSDLILVDSSADPNPETRTDATDENGDIAASTWHGAGGIEDISCTYALKSGTLNLNTLVVGEKTATTQFIESIEVAPTNAQWPQITVSGKKGLVAITAPDGKLNTFALPSITIKGIKAAQEMGFTTGANCKLTGASLSASCTMEQQDDGVGDPAAHGVSGGVMTVSADFVRITAAPSWTVTLADAEETKAPGVEQGQAAYHTGTGTYEYILTRGTPA